MFGGYADFLKGIVIIAIAIWVGWTVGGSDDD